MEPCALMPPSPSGPCPFGSMAAPLCPLCVFVMLSLRSTSFAGMPACAARSTSTLYLLLHLRCALLRIGARLCSRAWFCPARSNRECHRIHNAKMLSRCARSSSPWQYDVLATGDFRPDSVRMPAHCIYAMLVRTSGCLRGIVQKHCVSGFCAQAKQTQNQHHKC